MTCPRCCAEFDTGPKSCPECGVRLMRSVSGVMKTSSVMIAAGDTPSFYRSVGEVPEPLRSQLIETTQSENSGLILIADRAGKDQIAQVLARRENDKQRRAAGENPTGARKSGHRSKTSARSWVALAGILLFLAAAGIIAAVFAMHAAPR